MMRLLPVSLLAMVLLLLYPCVATIDTKKNIHSNETLADNNTVSKFDWDIYKLNITVMPSLPVDVKVKYNISKRETVVTLYEFDCTTPIFPTNLIDINKTFDALSNKYGILDVNLRIGSSYKNSSIWTEESSTVGYLDFCVRVDLLLVDGRVEGNFPSRPISVNFRETKISLKASREGMEMVDDFGDVTISACQCNRFSRSCINDTVVSLQSDIFLCMETNYQHVLFLGVETLEFVTKDKTNERVVAYTPIKNSRANAVTAVTRGEPRGLVVTRLGARLMDTVANMSVEGIAILAFDDSRGRRRLGRSRIRYLQQEEQDGDGPGFFQLEMSIDTSTVRPLPLWVIIMFAVMGCVVTITFGRRIHLEMHHLR